MTTTSVLAKGKFTETEEFARRLDKLAEVAVRVGLGLGAGQEMVMTATLEHVRLARRIIEHAYRAGASVVAPMYADLQRAVPRSRLAGELIFGLVAGGVFEATPHTYRGAAAPQASPGL